MHLVDSSTFTPSNQHRSPSTVYPPLLFSLAYTPVSDILFQYPPNLNQVLTMVVVLIYINISASLLPQAGALSFYLLAIANASSIVGRYVAGSISDRLGRGPSHTFQMDMNPPHFFSGPMNVMIPLTAAAGILTYVWPFARTKASLISVTVIYG